MDILKLKGASSKQVAILHGLHFSTELRDKLVGILLIEGGSASATAIIRGIRRPKKVVSLMLWQAIQDGVIEGRKALVTTGRPTVTYRLLIYPNGWL